LVLSNVNPFLGQRLDGAGRRCFEEVYEVAVLSVRHVGQELGAETAVPRGHVTSGGPLGDDGVLRRGSPAAADLLVSPPVGRLWPGDTLLVLAQRGEACKKLGALRDFLAVTLVDCEEAASTRWADYVPLALFVAGLVAVATQQMSMVKVAVLLLVLFVAGQWIEPAQLIEYFDLNIVILMGSALGLAEAVVSSGLSSIASSYVISMGLGPSGTVSALFLFTMLISETVTTSASAALAFPLALDLSRDLGLTSAKPLVMTVLAAASTSFANPIAQVCYLIVMGSGRYSFKDFLRVGLPMDLLLWIAYSIVIPLVWSLD
jgi:di/tricarboxylate transporter